VAVSCSVCGARAAVHPAAAEAVVAQHRAHQGAPGRYGAGDLVAAVAKPIARVLGRQPCTPCEQRRHALNRLAPALWPRR
jgi:hypothetical protein